MGKKMMSGLSLYRHYVSASVRSSMQYKASLLLIIMGQLLMSTTTLFGIRFMFMRFHHVKGYAYGEVLLCFAIVLMQFSLAEMFGRGFDMFAGIVRRGEFDRVLVRPRSAILQVLGAKFEISRIGRLIQSGIIFIYVLVITPIEWTPGRVFCLMMMLAGGVLLFGALFLLQAGICFFTLEGLEFMNIFTDGGREYGKYPLDIYGSGIMRFSIYVIPYALVQYYPLQYLLGRRDNVLLSLCPLGVCGFLAVAYGVWRIGVRRYTSSGS